MARLQLSADPIGAGRERRCYVHPEDPRKAIKILRGRDQRQTQREIKFYRQLNKRNPPTEMHLPRYYGQDDTNLGRGIVVDLIRDYDGQVSRALQWYLTNDYNIEMFEPCLIELKHWFVDNLILFDRDLALGNLLLQKTSFNSAKLIAIGGFGEFAAGGRLELFRTLARRKIERRWAQFIERLYRAPEISAQRDKDDVTTLSPLPPAGDR